VEIQHVDEISDIGSAILEQVKREHAPKFVAAQASLERHGRTVA
jgi:hypothetical protein